MQPSLFNLLEITSNQLSLFSNIMYSSFIPPCKLSSTTTSNLPNLKQISRFFSTTAKIVHAPTPPYRLLAIVLVLHFSETIQWYKKLTTHWTMQQVTLTRKIFYTTTYTIFTIYNIFMKSATHSPIHKHEHPFTCQSKTSSLYQDSIQPLLNKHNFKLYHVTIIHWSKIINRTLLTSNFTII